MMYKRNRATYLGDDAGGLPSSELLFPSMAQPAPSNWVMVLPDTTITATPPEPLVASPYGTGPATLPATAPVPLTEDEIAEAYGGNAIIKVFHDPGSLFTKTNLMLAGAFLGVATIAMSFKGKSRRRGRR